MHELEVNVWGRGHYLHLSNTFVLLEISASVPDSNIDIFYMDCCCDPKWLLNQIFYQPGTEFDVVALKGIVYRAKDTLSTLDNLIETCVFYRVLNKSMHCPDVSPLKNGM
ncbi:hypothetical protein NPIL_578351 [Nephila pilipes]|uniref:Uncharacterized protein n=1 Tax=Nephila pilipes TaxID=299642 RepID=A0A8X6P899_NEPPI|nr:hypothetical protein NPIL_578351 [Nephila pilipes]